MGVLADLDCFVGKFSLVAITTIDDLQLRLHLDIRKIKEKY